MRSKMPIVLAAITVVFAVIGILFMPADPALSGGSGSTVVKAAAPTGAPVAEKKEEPKPPPGADEEVLPVGVKSVEVYWSGKWLPGTVLERKAGQIKVHVRGDNVNSTIWTAEINVRRPTSASAFVPGAAQSQ